MILNEAVAKLTVLVPKLNASDANFANGLIAAYKKYGSLTVKQAPWVEKLIARAEAPVKPVFSAPLTPSITNPPAAVNVGDFAGVTALFNAAKAHLKFPKVNLIVNGHKVVLSLNGEKSKKPGFVSINSDGKYGYRKFYGSVSPEGVFTPWSITASFGEALVKLLTEFSANPARVAKDHGKLTGHCCFCNKELGLGEDKRSVAVGFGPVCAEHYGLKDQWLAGVAKAEAKASVTPVVSAFDVTPESQAKVLIDTAAATLPVLSVQDEVKANLEKSTTNFLTPQQTDAVEAAKLQQAFLDAQHKATPEPLTITTEPTLTISPKALEEIEQISKNIALVGEAVLKGTTATSGFVQSVATSMAEAEKTAITEAQLDKWLNLVSEDKNDSVSEEFKDDPNGPTLGGHLVPCFFCETPKSAAEMIDGYPVCPSCKEQLK